MLFLIFKGRGHEDVPIIGPPHRVVLGGAQGCIQTMVCIIDNRLPYAQQMPFLSPVKTVRYELRA